jgi:[acyl-carrier-protein] S-malonyltransferase
MDRFFMKRAYLFPGQASQFPGMGKDLYESSELARDLIELSNDILGFRISDVMFEGSEEDLKQTAITQPAVFIYSLLKARLLGDAFLPDGVAGHSLGEFTALVAANALRFEDGLLLVKERAEAMQMACEAEESTMAAIVGLDDVVIENICKEIDGIVVPANYNCPGQLVIAGEVPAVEKATVKLTEAGARRAIILQVGGAFHSPLMQLAQDRLTSAIEKTAFLQPICPIYQNVDAKAHINSDEIKANLIAQLTRPVRWTDTMKRMIDDGFDHFTECGGSVLSGFLKRIDRKMSMESV